MRENRCQEELWYVIFFGSLVCVCVKQMNGSYVAITFFAIFLKAGMLFCAQEN